VDPRQAQVDGGFWWWETPRRRGRQRASAGGLGGGGLSAPACEGAVQVVFASRAFRAGLWSVDGAPSAC
jgi:hypothetical protein